MTNISDLLGLNYPRGPLVNAASTLPQSPVGFGRKKFQTSTPLSHYHYKVRNYLGIS